eukprot:2010205-Rhodomonas_salina.1
MGSQAAEVPAVGGAVPLPGEACAAFGVWLAGFDMEALAAATDHAMACLLAGLVSDLPCVLQDWNAESAGAPEQADGRAAAAAVALEATLAAAGRA